MFWMFHCYHSSNSIHQSWRNMVMADKATESSDPKLFSVQGCTAVHWGILLFFDPSIQHLSQHKHIMKIHFTMENRLLLPGGSANLRESVCSDKYREWLYAYEDQRRCMWNPWWCFTLETHDDVSPLKRMMMFNPWNAWWCLTLETPDAG